MINEMELFYTDKEQFLPKVTSLDPNILYAAKVDGTWLRIQLHSIIDETKVNSNLFQQHTNNMNKHFQNSSPSD